MGGGWGQLTTSLSHTHSLGVGLGPWLIGWCEAGDRAMPSSLSFLKGRKPATASLFDV